MQRTMTKRLIVAFVCLLGYSACIEPAEAQLDGASALDPVVALGSWNDCATKRSLIAYVQRVCDSKSSDYVPPAERIAVYDNDGTLWPENPVPFQLAYAFDVVEKKAASDPQFAKHPMVQAVLSRDIPTLLAGMRDSCKSLR